MPSILFGFGCRGVMRVLMSLPARRPPSVTLFPYTTLFRSPLQHPHVRKEGHAGQRRQEHAGRGQGGRQDPGREIGRSTRLNSSHVSISYAVFCLKKKTARTR